MNLTSISIEQLGLQRFTEVKLKRNVAENLAELFAAGGRSVVQITGFGTAARDETARAILRLLPEFAKKDQELARQFLEELQFRPGDLPRHLGATPRDFRCLLYEFQDISNRRSVDVMKHRLGLDGGPRRTKEETAEALGVSERVVNQTDYQVAKHLKESESFQWALDWLLGELDNCGGLITVEQLAGSLDRSCITEPGEVHAALRLLDRVYGFHTPWVYRDGWIVDRRLFEFCLAVSAREPGPPYKVSDLVALLQEETECGPAAARLSSYLHSETELTLDPAGKVVVATSDSPGVGAWATYFLSKSRRPMEQPKLLRKLSKLGFGSVSNRDFWSLMRRDPRIVKVSLHPSVWGWLPHLDVSEEEIASLKERAANYLRTQDEPINLQELHEKLAPPNKTITPVFLGWLLRKDDRFRTSHQEVGLKTSG